jgi:hypothetical protein
VSKKRLLSFFSRVCTFIYKKKIKEKLRHGYKLDKTYYNLMKERLKKNDGSKPINDHNDDIS